MEPGAAVQTNEHVARLSRQSRLPANAKADNEWYQGRSQVSLHLLYNWRELQKPQIEDRPRRLCDQSSPGFLTFKWRS